MIFINWKLPIHHYPDGEFAGQIPLTGIPDPQSTAMMKQDLYCQAFFKDC